MIFGVVRRDGVAVAPELLGRMSGAVAERSSAGASTFVEGPVGLGQACLPRDRDGPSRRPLATFGGATLCLDGRIDEGLERDTASREPADRRTGAKADLAVLSAYLNGGRAALEPLIGDFAFGLWDDTRRTLILGRDAIGVRPLYYADTPSLFAFATDLRALLALAEIPAEIDEIGIAHLFFPELLFEDRESTSYRSIRRLPPAHHFEIGIDGAAPVRHRTWSLDETRELRLSSDEEYAEAFLETFRRAVECRLDADPIGSTLSGGLDSSSITCMARSLLRESGGGPLHTFSAGFASVPEADESEFRAPVLAGGDLEPHLLALDERSPLVDLERVVGAIAEPFFGPNYFIPWGICSAARACEVPVVLDGTDGDVTVGHGVDQLVGLAEAGRWDRFIAEAGAITSRFDHPAYATESGILRAHGLPALERHVRHGRLWRFLRGVNRLGRWAGHSRLGLVREHGFGAFRAPARPEVPEFLDLDFVRRVRLESRLWEFQEARSGLRPGPRASHHRDLTSGALPAVLEVLDRIAAAHSVEYRFPYCDRRLVELCLSLPPGQKLRNGWSRWVLRQAMVGVLPEGVRWREGKTAMSPVYRRGLRRFEEGRLQSIVARKNAALYRYVRRDRLEAAHLRFLAEGRTADRQLLWSAVILDQWLQSVDIEELA
ncbi:MAG: asparagine synthetase B family protein [Thermoanaerobaculia bacterium]